MNIAHSSPGITTGAASEIARGAVAFAEANGWRVNIAVTDRSGLLMSFLRMPEAFVGSINLAIDKAYTAASFGFPTRSWMQAIGHDEGMKLGFAAQPRLIVFGGGLPIRLHRDDREWIGGVGVSGASDIEDEECARAGLRAIGLEA